MTMFTEGRLQAYERMMHQTYMSRGRDHGSKNQKVKVSGMNAGLRYSI